MTVKFSIVVPVFEHWDLVPKLLCALRSQSLPADQFELILVDNDGKASNLNSVTHFNEKVVRCESPGSYAARNAGVAASSGQWLVFTDADCLPRPDWLWNINEALLSQPKESTVFAGAVEIVSRTSSPNFFEIYDIVKGIPQDAYVKKGYAATANLVIASSLVSDLKGFNPSLFSGGDIEFCQRAVKSGANIIFLSNAVVEHPTRKSWGELIVKTRRIKGGQFQSGVGYIKLWLFIRTVLPPLRAVTTLIQKPQFPLSYRFSAVAIQVVLWIFEIGEIIRLFRSYEPERR